jgi:uncharacterized protein YhaN
MKEHLSDDMEIYLKRSYSNCIDSKEFSRKESKNKLQELLDMISALTIPAKFKESLTHQIKELMNSNEAFGIKCGMMDTYKEILDLNEKVREDTEKKVAS